MHRLGQDVSTSYCGGETAACVACSPRCSRSLAMQRSTSCSGSGSAMTTAPVGAHRQRVEERLCQVRYAPRALEEADDFALVVGNGEFIEGADAASEQEHDVGTPDRNDVASFEPKARVDRDR